MQKEILFQLVLTHDCTVNFIAYGTTHIYLPNCKAGHILASSYSLPDMRNFQQEYFRAGYGTTIKEIVVFREYHPEQLDNV